MEDSEHDSDSDGIQFVEAPRGQEHPALQNPLILDEIFKRCSVNDLKTCRLVSTFWSRTALGAWKDSAFVKIADDAKMSSFMHFLQVTKEANTWHIYVNYSLTVTRHKMVITNFWDECAWHLKSLEISNYAFPSPENFREVIFGQCISMEHLVFRSVTIKSQDCKGDDGMEIGNASDLKFAANRNMKSLKLIGSSNRGISWFDIFMQFPSLQVLHVIEFQESGKLKKIFRTISSIRHKHPDKLPLINLSLHDKTLFSNAKDFSSSVIHSLVDTRLPLQVLSMSLGNGRNTETNLRNILQTHRQTLRVLELQGRYSVRLRASNFIPVEIEYRVDALLANLQEIKLSSNIFTSLEFLKLTPNLKRLSVNNSGSENNIIGNTNISDMEGMRLEKCMELELCDFVTVQEMLKLTSWLPNVEILKCPLNNATLSLVCEYWPRMISLDISRGEVDECGITGLDQEHVEMVNRAEGIWFGMQATVQRANISNLKHLRKLSLERKFTFEPNTCHLSHASILFGMTNLPNIQQIRVKNYLLDPALWDNLLPQLRLVIDGDTGQNSRLAFRRVCARIRQNRVRW